MFVALTWPSVTPCLPEPALKAFWICTSNFVVCEPNENGFFFFGGNKSQHRHHSAASSPRAWLNLHPAPGQRAGKPFLPAPCPSVRLERMWGAFAEVSYSPCEIPNRREPGLAQQRGRKAFGHFSPCLCSQSQSHLPGMRQGLF